MDAIAIIKIARQTHVIWAEYFEKYPATKDYEEYKYIGNAKFHREYIEDYDKVIAEIEQLQAELALTKEHIKAAIDDLPECPDSAKEYLEHALKGK